jgi:RNA polymerase sigma-70 factor (ECF subfamily)
MAELEGLDQTLEWGDENLNPEQEFIAGELEKRITVVIERLPVAQQMVLRLFHHDEMSLEEISEITQLSINTVKSHLFRGRLTIKNSVQQ